MRRILVINAKTYPEATGNEAIKLARICDELSDERCAIVLALQPFDLAPAKRETRKVIIAAQHVDDAKPGRNTGYIVPANLKSIGISWTLLNHSEHKLPFNKLASTIKLLKACGFSTILCADDVEEAKKAVSLKPDYIALEPPELIAGDVPVTDADPRVITESLKAVGAIPLLVGAGIKRSSDVRRAVELGAAGVLVSSGVVKAHDRREVIKGFVRALL